MGYLKNEQSLQGCEAYFYDLAEAFAEITETAIYPTLNFRENPRWGVLQIWRTVSQISGANHFQFKKWADYGGDHLCFTIKK